MKYEIVMLEEQRVQGIGIKTNHETAIKDIGQLWHRYITEELSRTTPNQVSNLMVGLYSDYEGDETQPYHFLCGVRVSDDDAKVIEKGQYAKFSATGQLPSVVGDLWQGVYQSDLKRAFITDFELYDPKEKGEVYVELYIGIL